MEEVGEREGTAFQHGTMSLFHAEMSCFEPFGLQELEDNASRVTEEMADDDDDAVESKSAENAEAKGAESARPLKTFQCKHSCDAGCALNPRAEMAWKDRRGSSHSMTKAISRSIIHQF